MVIIYRGGPYAGQIDYLKPPPHRLPANGGNGYYERSGENDAAGQVIYAWVDRAAIPASEETATGRRQ